MPLPPVHELQARAFMGPLDQLDQLIEWLQGSPSVLRHYKLDTITRGAHMQRTFIIELRVDFADKEKLGPLTQTLKHSALHALANARLLSDNPKSTQIAVYTDDFFAGRQEIELMDDVIQKGLDTIGVATEADAISQEMRDAFK